MRREETTDYIVKKNVLLKQLTVLQLLNVYNFNNEHIKYNEIFQINNQQHMECRRVHFGHCM